ncbi:hypothetical protein JTE90_014729 [Oedothorax gibbosus]|uniref:Venom protein n=1 Tax=Oedothorax gibbosus TaxID=931172 RepID=A0AAV6USM7_9ARAC|nr:hypothetical protein JTE90_014729 [Oedothorax gibbosus]
MKYLAIFLLYCMVECVVNVVLMDTIDEKYKIFTRNVCENNRTINEEMNDCFQKSSQVVLDLTNYCINRVQPSAMGNVVNFFELACKDKYAYIKYYICMSAYELDTKFKEQMKWSPDIIACFKEVAKKYG